MHTRKVEARASEILKGSIDMHMHTSPDVHPRILDDIEAAEQAKAAGMKAIVVKNHYTITSDRAEIAKKVTNFPVFGGVVLNHHVGGLNVHAVKAAVELGAKEIWMPTINASNYLKHAEAIPTFAAKIPKAMKGISVVDKRGRLLPAVTSILKIVAENNVILGTGHLSVQESLALIDEAVNAGVKKILVTHPQASFIGFTIEEMKKAVEKGAILEHDFVICTRLMKEPISPSLIAKAIRAVGAENCVMSTDGGQNMNPVPVELFKQFIVKMLEFGITADEIQVMIQENPSKLLGI